MKKRAYIIHGWDGSPQEGWFPWLKQELEKADFAVEVPAMPEPSYPKIEAWISHLALIVGDVDENVFFIGHSIGCQTVLRFLERLPGDKKARGAVLVAPWLTLTNLHSVHEKEIAEPWLKTPIDFEKVKLHSTTFFALFSDNDKDVPISNKELFEQRLGTETAVLHDKGHCSGGDGVTELPSVLKTVLRM